MGLEITHPILGEYLKFTQNTESPALFHAWAFLSGISAALGRRCYYEFGSYRTLPNMFIILCGPTSVRKSSAIEPVRQLLSHNTGIRFAPSDTGGQRQGLIEAMLGDSQQPETEESKKVDKFLDQQNLMTMFNDDIVEKIGEMRVDIRDPNSMFISASSLSAILGENNNQLLTFLKLLYDGEDYTYKLKYSTRVLENCVLGMLAGTTASAFAQSVPSPISGQEFMARCVFVYADEQKVRKIPRPSLNESYRPKFAELFRRVFDELEGKFDETQEAAGIFDKIYLRGVSFLDQRFVQYTQRRQAHLQKVAMAFAASRLSKTIEDFDVQAADSLLAITEDGMPYALGEYGLAKTSAAKAHLIETVNSLTEPTPTSLVYAQFHRDLTDPEIAATIAEMQSANRIRMVSVPGIPGYCIIGVSTTDSSKKRKRKELIENTLIRASLAKKESTEVN